MKYALITGMVFMMTQFNIGWAGEDVRYIVFMRATGQVFDQSRPETINVSEFEKVKQHFTGLNDNSIKIGMACAFSYLNNDIETVKQSLQNFLDCSTKTEVPVLIKFDGQQWWEGRPDLWNWWDPSEKGYSPENRNNVEWTDWESSSAIKIAWRNWGKQIRVVPPPNLMSPAYRTACHEAMDELMPMIMQWWTSLPPDKKHLFIGLNVGWETSIGYNAYYYPNGNRYLDKPLQDDPLVPSDRKDVLKRGHVQIGYAAVKTAGIRSAGQITENDLYEVCSRHLEDFSKRAFEFGFPREKIFTHGVGNEFGEKLYDAAVNDYSCPGWSDYWYADDPMKDKGIVRGISLSDAPHWAAVEYLLLKPYQEQLLWRQAIEKTISCPGCKFLCIYNWEGITSEDSKVIHAIKNVISENGISKSK